jgi:hypothetical protein
MTDCTHERRVLLRLDTGAGGQQFRMYCVKCWHAGPALPHRDIKNSDEVPQADAELIDKARSAFWRQIRERAC